MAKSDKAASGYAAWKDSFPDFTLIVRGKELKCHKSFLSMNSPVLKSMLSIDYKETKSNRMEIRNFDEETVANFLQYIYAESTCSECGTRQKISGKDRYIYRKNIDREIFNRKNVDREIFTPQLLDMSRMYEVEDLQSDCAANLGALKGTSPLTAPSVVKRHQWRPNSQFFKPLQAGWKREVVYGRNPENGLWTDKPSAIVYHAPKAPGVKSRQFHNMGELGTFIANSDLSLQNFSFRKDPMCAPKDQEICHADDEEVDIFPPDVAALASPPPPPRRRSSASQDKPFSHSPQSDSGVKSPKSRLPFSLILLYHEFMWEIWVKSERPKVASGGQKS